MVNDSVNSNDMVDGEVVDSINKFVLVFIFNLIIVFICLILFCILRQKYKIIYVLRQFLIDMLVFGKCFQLFFLWFFFVFIVKDDEVFFYVGIDVVVYMWFMKFCFKIVLVFMLYGIIVLIFVNYYGGGDLSGLEQIVLLNIVVKLLKVWVYIVVVWLYILIICYFLYMEWKVFIVY